MFNPISTPHRERIVGGLGVFYLLTLTMRLDGPVVLVLSAFLWLFMFPHVYWVTQTDAGRKFRDVVNLFEQSWSLYGCALLLLPAYLAAIHQWGVRPADLPSWARQWWWVLVAGVVGVVLSRLFVRADKHRYDPRSRDEPAKRYFDDVLVPLFLALVVARVVPVLLAPWNGYTVVIAGLVLGWVVLMAFDGLRYFAGLPDWAPAWAERWYQKCRLIPEKQHPPYNKEFGCYI